MLLLLIALSFLASCDPDKTEEPAVAANSTIVYVTKSGTKYHREGCQYLSKSSREITLEEAKDKGYEPCSKCNPPE